eukprot:TRINITY_DN3773_c0_g1_i2.p1 TRINITY_DN3773_c0_g1~~TRINITY_DN3773_c0_g1_i2.p1  ORF type:complete len:477 (-),score=102.24 TRINITY_DN3773_c0_g1_i2:91-1521(-)
MLKGYLVILLLFVTLSSLVGPVDSSRREKKEQNDGHYHNRFSVKLIETANPDAVAADHGFSNWGPIKDVPGWYTFGNTKAKNRNGSRGLFLDSNVLEYKGNSPHQRKKRTYSYNDQSNEKKKKLDPLPRVILISKLGLVTIDLSYQASVISRDIYTHSIKIIQNAEKAGRYSPVSPKDLWDMEYWTLEQAKLGTVTRKSLDGNVVYVTGAASGIGRACLDAFASAGASLFIVDLNEGLLDEAIQSIKSKYKSVHIDGQSIDITMPSAVIQSFKHCIKSYGGVDIIISNAGIGYQSQVKDTETMKNSFEINFWSHQYVASTAVDIFLLQNQGSSCSVSLNIGSEDNQHSPSKMGGCLLFNVSKAAVNPGPMFGPYAVAKASTMALMKQYAIDYGADNIRSNAVNADRIRTNFFSQEDLEKRAKARNLPVEEYFKSNLLQQEVTASDVAREFLNMALASKTTTATITVDGGNVAASLR